MTMPGRIAYFVVLLFLAVLSFSVRLDLWVSLIVAVVAMAGAALFETLLARRQAAAGAARHDAMADGR